MYHYSIVYSYKDAVERVEQDESFQDEYDIICNNTNHIINFDKSYDSPFIKYEDGSIEGYWVMESDKEPFPTIIFYIKGKNPKISRNMANRIIGEMYIRMNLSPLKVIDSSGFRGNEE